MAKNNKWWLIVIYCLVSVIILSTIVSCFVKVSYKPEIANPEIYYAQSNNEYITGDKQLNTKVYDEINKAFNDAFKENLLSSLFSSRIRAKSRIESSSKLPTFSGYQLRLSYTQEQTIMLNGEVYKPSTNTSQTIHYEQIYVDVVAEQGMSTNYIYYEYYSVSSSGVVSTKPSYYKQTVVCNFDELYNVLAGY